MGGRFWTVAQAAVTWGLVGLNWTVLVVVYPLLARVDAPSFQRFHADYTARIALVVGPAMVAELLLALRLMGRNEADGVSNFEAWTGFLAVAAIWGVTGFWSVPMHQRLEGSFDADAHRSLLTSQVVRTALWTGRGLLTAGWLLRAW
jgi:hypothetical protein